VIAAAVPSLHSQTLVTYTSPDTRKLQTIKTEIILIRAMLKETILTLKCKWHKLNTSISNSSKPNEEINKWLYYRKEAA